MARGPEGSFWKRVRGSWCGHSLRVEASNGDVEPGTPDTILSIGYAGGYVELKVWPDNVSAVQLAWHEEAHSLGAYCRVLSRIRGDRVWLGSAKAYSKLVASGVRPAGIHLQAALDMIRCELIGRSSIRSQK